MTASKKIHFVGIGGIGMSGIAKILLRSGYRVSGSDPKENKETADLRDMGAEIFTKHEAANLQSADALVYSSAVPQDNPEYQEAIRQRIPILARAEMLAELMRKKHTIVVAGAHGKTTTSAMITALLHECGFDPTAVIGGRLKSMGGNAKLGTDDWFVCESDESDGSFLKLFPTLAVITNIDAEHLNHYGTFENLKQAFLDFANRVPFDGVVVVCKDDPHVLKMIPSIRRRVVTYGMDSTADLSAQQIEVMAHGMRFDLYLKNKKVCRVDLPAIGKHNVLNALAAIAIGLQLDLSAEKIADGMSRFSGIERRLEWKGCAKEVDVIDDYAHHPTEIRASLNALRGQNPTRKVKVLFQPHRYTRVRDCWDEFVAAFDDAQELVLTPIYAASEPAITGIQSDRLATQIEKRKKTNVKLVANIDEGASYLATHAQSGDVIVTMGAGDITKASPWILNAIETQQKRGPTV